jgi:hypothetical protein
MHDREVQRCVLGLRYDKAKVMRNASKHIGFIFLLSLLAIIYIANTHRAERKLRKINALQKSVDDAKSRYQKVKSDNTYNSTESQLAKELVGNGLKINSDAPFVINSSQ